MKFGRNSQDNTRVKLGKLSLGDFFRRNAQTPLSGYYSVGGVLCKIATNAQPILDAAGACFCRIDSTSIEPKLNMRFWVDLKGPTQSFRRKPFFRGKGNLIFAGFDSESAVLVDLGSRRGIGRFSLAVGSDKSYWQSVIFPSLISIMSATVGIAELHCGCVAKEGNGLLLAGRSGSGKSTLAFAMARAGYGYVSDDRTFCSEWNGRLTLWGLPTALKLRLPSAEFFQEFRGRVLDVAPKGEPAFLIDPDSHRGIERIQHCEPRWLVFLERQEQNGFNLASLSPAEAAGRLEENMIAETPDSTSLQRTNIGRLVELPCWRLTYGGPPQLVAQELARQLEREMNQNFHHRPIAENPGTKHIPANPRRKDLLRRFTSTPLVADLQVMGRVVRLETDSHSMLNRARALFARYGKPGCGQPDFVWKISCEADPKKRIPWPCMSAFSDKGLRFVNIGQCNFLAIDLNARNAVGYLTESLIEDEGAFVSPFVTTLFCMTAGALRLTPLAAACVKMEDKGLLVLGKPNNGKTTSSYLAARLGFEFYSDRAVFLDLDQGGLRAWADFAPAAFRNETSAFLPELRSLGRPFAYQEQKFLYVEDSTSIRDYGDPVIPFSCVFLERCVTKKPRLTPLNPTESCRRLRQGLPFEDDERFEVQHSAALSALAQLPAYLLAYGDDPAEAAAFFPSLLDSSRLVEANAQGTGRK